MVISINKLEKSYSELSAFFSNAGHFLMHYFVAMYFTIILALERDWNAAYESLFELWFPASIFIGLFAIPAGRLADKWSSPGMLIIMFLGMGLATVFCGFSETQNILMIFLGFLGIFAAIYHPVGIPWTIKTSKKKPGMRLAINGLFGGIGASGAAIITGWIIANYGWRASFLIPGILCFILGFVMFFSLQLGFIEEGSSNIPEKKELKEDSANIKGVIIMMIPMFIMGLIYSSIQGVMPKLFEERMPELLDGRIELIGTIVGSVYVVGAISQILGGYLADRLPLKNLYLGLWIIQAPLLLLISELGGITLAILVGILTMSGTSILPSENIILSKFASKENQGLTFGIKFLVSFCAAPIGVFLITYIREMTGQFNNLIIFLSILSLFACIAILFLPVRSEKKDHTKLIYDSAIRNN